MKLCSRKKLSAISVVGLVDGLFSMISFRSCHCPSLRNHKISSSVDNTVSSRTVLLLLYDLNGL